MPAISEFFMKSPCLSKLLFFDHEVSSAIFQLGVLYFLCRSELSLYNVYQVFFFEQTIGLPKVSIRFTHSNNLNQTFAVKYLYSCISIVKHKQFLRLSLGIQTWLMLLDVKCLFDQ